MQDSGRTVGRACTSDSYTNYAKLQHHSGGGLPENQGAVRSLRPNRDHTSRQKILAQLPGFSLWSVGWAAYASPDSGRNMSSNRVDEERNLVAFRTFLPYVPALSAAHNTLSTGAASHIERT